ncbi:MAG TPA: HAD family hydrolase [bacterium]|nr:MAG: D-glycero-beta-D-manno-heptose-1,7-bisphosphate 7-phosphatase [bacterium ADurb.Bin236]HOY62047.1 HAD family hydrolase [bacterium]HPI75893.1 HAD family hydrolase [bacterium]HPN94025.1 HAD family hydrolase [bacterium]
MSGIPAVFIDRDGTLSEEIGYVNHVSRFKLLEKSAAAIKKLNEANVPAVLVTNQAGVARGYFPERLIADVHVRMNELLAAGGAKLDGIYYCPHHPTAGEPPYRMDCDCRKPKTGLIDRAAAEMGLDAARSYMIGDKLSDVALAKRAGCAAGILVLTGYGRGDWEFNREREGVEPDFIAEDLLEAVDWLLKDLASRA